MKMESSPTIQRLVSRTFLALTTAAVCVAMLLGLVALFVTSAKGPTAMGNYTFSVRYVPPGVKDRPAEQPVTATKGDAYVDVDTVAVTTSENLAEPILLTNIARLSPFAVFYLGCAIVLVLIRRVWTGRSFTRLAAVALGVLGVLVIAVGKLVPWLQLRAVELAVQQLGLPTAPEASDPAAKGWLVPQPYGIESIDWTLVVLGVVLVFLAVLLHRGTKLQEDVEGLV